MISDTFLKKIMKPAVFISSLLPLFWLMWKALTDGLGANPVEKAIHRTGDWTLNFPDDYPVNNPAQEYHRVGLVITVSKDDRIVRFFTHPFISLHMQGLTIFSLWNLLLKMR